jgi:hypothetical protein
VSVHSTQLAVGSYTTGSYHTVYTVPSLKRTILKGVWLRNTACSANIVKINVHTVGGTDVYFYVNLVLSGSAGDSTFLNLWVVLNPGDVLKVQPTVSSVEAVFSGAELDL